MDKIVFTPGTVATFHCPHCAQKVAIGVPETAVVQLTLEKAAALKDNKRLTAWLEWLQYQVPSARLTCAVTDALRGKEPPTEDRK